MADKKELQEKLISYRLIEARIEELLRQREILLKNLVETEESINGIEELKNEGEEVIFFLGSRTYVPCRIIEKNKIIVEVGANIAIEKNLEDGKKILEKRKEKISQSIANIEAVLTQLFSKLQELDREIKKKMVEEKEG